MDAVSLREPVRHCVFAPDVAEHEPCEAHDAVNAGDGSQRREHRDEPVVITK